MTIIVKNIANAIGCLVLVLLVIFAVEKLKLTFFIIKYLLSIFISVYFLILLYVNKDAFKNIKIVYLRYLSLILLCLLMTIVYGFISYVIMVNSHLAIGGQL
jgi:O-antigen ligase